MSDEFVPNDDLAKEGAEEAPSTDEAAEETPATETDAPAGESIVDLKATVAERTEDLQRLQAEYVNYRKRVERDRSLARQSGVEAVLSEFMPVLDAISLARSHGDLAGGFKLVVDELEKVTSKYGMEAFGAVGEEFDPNLHEALMQQPMDAPVEVITISQVIQPGYRIKERIIRPARVAVAQPASGSAE